MTITSTATTYDSSQLNRSREWSKASVNYPVTTGDVVDDLDRSVALVAGQLVGDGAIRHRTVRTVAALHAVD